MEGRTEFTAAEADEIRTLLRRKTAASKTKQKAIRQSIRDIGFKISRFRSGGAGFTADDFDRLIAEGHVRITDEPPSGTPNSGRLGGWWKRLLSRLRRT